jgi:DeoR/GlpR family transcriptional regulator of sugar metabolism
VAVVDPAPDSASRSRDLAPERRLRIGELVAARRGARLDELSTILGVSQATVRRDLDQLASEGRLRRVHGGAVPLDSRPREVHFDLKAAAAEAEKARIAARAVEFLSPTETVFLDSGSTVLGVARLLHGWDQLTVVTNSLRVANELLERGPNVVVVGGELRARSEALVGPLSRHVLDELFVDRALIGTFALSLEHGLMTTDPAEAYTKQITLTRAREVILLADSRKVGTSSFVQAGRLESVDVLITDDGIDDAAVRRLERRGIRVIRV